MVLTSHQPAFFPWLGLFHKIGSADSYVHVERVQNSKSAWEVRRTKIKSPHGGTLWLTMPIAGAHEGLICDLLVDNNQPWRRRHWQSIVQCYRRAPFWIEYSPFLEDLYLRRWTLLAEFNKYVLLWLTDQLGVKPPLVLTDWGIGASGRKSNLVLDYCRKTRATVYVAGAGGKGYLDVRAFQTAGVQIVFREYSHPTYHQLGGPFISHLSALDLLFNCGPASRSILMSGQEMFDAALAQAIRVATAGSNLLQAPQRN